MAKLNTNPKSDGHVSNKRGSGRVAWQGYVNYTPTADDKRNLKAMLASGNRPSDALPDVLLAGYKLSITYDTYHSSFSATLYCQIEGSPDAGKALSQRAGNVDSAIERLLFVHCFVLVEGWGATPAPADNWD